MKKFHSNSKGQLMKAIFQEQTYVLITPDQEKKISLSGSLKNMEAALREAIENNSQFRSIVLRALQPAQKQSTPVLFNVLTTQPAEI